MTAIRQKIGRVGLRTRGTWTNNPSEPYMTLDVVDKDGSSYISEVDNNTSIPPSTSWQIMSQRGESGLGVPVGGTTGQVLKKKSNTDFDTEWSSDNAPVLSVNSKTGEVTLNASDVGALPSSTKYGATLDMSLNTTDYTLTVSLKDQDGTVLNYKTVDFPIESVVVSGSYDSTNKKIVLTLQNGNTIDVPVGDLVAGLQSEITALNMLDADLVDDTTSTHKFVTTSEKSTWNAKYDKPSSGIPASDIASGVIPTVPTISTNIESDGSSDAKTASPKAVKSFVEGKGYTTNTGTITSVKMNGSTIASSGEADLGTVITSHQDISGKADKSEMSVVDGTGADADKTTITLKTGTSATVLKSHQSLSGKQDVIDSSHKLSADLVDDTNTTNKFTNATEKQTWNDKQDALTFNTAYDASTNKAATMADVPVVTGKADKVNNATSGNFAALDSNGNLTDSGHKHSDYLTSHQDISGKEDVTTIVAPVNATDVTLPVTSLTCEIGKYYRIDVPVETLAVTLPAMTDTTVGKAVVLFLTGGTAPAVTITSTAPAGGTAPAVHLADGFEIKAGETNEVNCYWNGLAWIVASVKIVISNS